MSVPLVVIALLYLACIPFPAARAWTQPAHVVVVAILMVHILRMTRCNLDDDLVAARRQFTRIVAVLVPMVCAVIGLVEAYELLRLHTVVPGLLISVMLFAVSVLLGFGIAGTCCAE